MDKLGFVVSPEILHPDPPKSIDDIRLPNHLVEPVFYCCVLGPPVLWPSVPVNICLDSSVSYHAVECYKIKGIA